MDKIKKIIEGIIMFLIYYAIVVSICLFLAWIMSLLGLHSSPNDDRPERDYSAYYGWN